MTITYVNCMGASPAGEHDIYRLTFVPANAIVGSLLSRWPDACAGVFEAVASGYCYPVQGQPTIIDTPSAGKVCVFDVKPNVRAGGQTIQQMAQVASDAYPTTRVQQVERLQSQSELLNARPTAQTATAEQVGAAVQSSGSWYTSLGSVGKWAVVGLIALAIFAVAVKVPKVSAA